MFFFSFHTRILFLLESGRNSKSKSRIRSQSQNQSGRATANVCCKRLERQSKRDLCMLQWVRCIIWMLFIFINHIISNVLRVYKAIACYSNVMLKKYDEYDVWAMIAWALLCSALFSSRLSLSFSSTAVCVSPLAICGMDEGDGKAAIIPSTTSYMHKHMGRHTVSNNATSLSQLQH